MGKTVEDHFIRWLRAGMTGCSFAQRIARVPDQLVAWSPGQAPTASEIDRFFDDCGAFSQVAIMIFPLVRDECGVVALIDSLCSRSSRWRSRRREAPDGAVYLGLDWITAAGDVSDTMGFAPFASMPVPRRAPYVAIGAWPGGRANPHRDSPPTPRPRAGKVSFLDAGHHLDADRYGRAWVATSAAIGELMAVPPDDARLYRDVAFAISATASPP